MTKLISSRRYVGQKFGLIELIEKRELRGKNYQWLVKCHGCGGEYVRSSSFKKTTQSCGCQLKRRNNQSPNWRGFGEISSSTISHYKVNAKKRNIDFLITPEYMWKLFLLQDRKCALTGLKISFGRYSRDGQTASLDRIDSNKPYQIGNVQWLHKHVNMMKSNHDQKYFIKLCKLIAK